MQRSFPGDGRTAPRASRLFGTTLAVALAGAYVQQASAGGVIFNNVDPALATVALGVNDLGHLNFQSLQFGTANAGFTGIAARFGDGLFYDATAPGCLCEGWGLALSLDGGGRVAGFANEAQGTGGLTGGSFGSTTIAATSMTSLADAPMVSITHAYGISLASNVFQGNVTITNNGASTLGDIVYRRVMDWDVPPTEFDEYVSHYGVVANLEAAGGNVRYASNNGFASSDPRVFAGVTFAGDGSFDPTNVDFEDFGYGDHGSVFDFAFGDLAPGESRSFNIFYGVAANEAEANDAIGVLNPNVWSFGQSALNLGGGGGEGCGEDCPATAMDGEFGVAAITDGPLPNNDGYTFIFAFGGVGGIEPGSDPEHPILPFVPAPGEFEFPAPIPRRWYDPPFADGFEYSLEEGEFLSVMIDEGFGTLLLEVGEEVFELTALDEFVFADEGLDDVALFRITGLPLLDVAAPDFSTAFPTFLDFTGDADGLRMTALTVQPVPVPAALPLMATALGALAWRRRRVLFVARV